MRVHETAEEADQHRLARTVGPEEGVDLARVDLQIHVVERCSLPKTPDDSARGNGWTNPKPLHIK